MTEFFAWLAASPIRLVEVFFGVFLLLAAILFSEGGVPSIILYGMGALLLFLTLYSYLKRAGSGR